MARNLKALVVGLLVCSVQRLLESVNNHHESKGCTNNSGECKHWKLLIKLISENVKDSGKRGPLSEEIQSTSVGPWSQVPIGVMPR